jgi:hypothetical protein
MDKKIPLLGLGFELPKHIACMAIGTCRIYDEDDEKGTFMIKTVAYHKDVDLGEIDKHLAGEIEFSDVRVRHYAGSGCRLNLEKMVVASTWPGLKNLVGKKVFATDLYYGMVDWAILVCRDKAAKKIGIGRDAALKLFEFSKTLDKDEERYNWYEGDDGEIHKRK